MADGSFDARAGEAGPGLVKDSTSETGILEFSRSEAKLRRMKRSVRQACDAHVAATENAPAVMFTFTHRRGETPEPRDVTKVVHNLRNWCLRKLGMKSFRYVWVAELQGDRARMGDAGAVHYHVAVWVTPELKRKAAQLASRNHRFRESGVLPKPDKKRWWTKGSTERDWVRTSIKAYLSKYLSKGEDAGDFPRGLRIAGAGGFDASQRPVRSHWMLPRWMREQCTPGDRAKRATGGGFETIDGRRFASPWYVLTSGRVVRMLKRVPENMDAILADMRACADRMFTCFDPAPQYSGRLMRAAGAPGPDVPF